MVFEGFSFMASPWAQTPGPGPPKGRFSAPGPPRGLPWVPPGPSAQAQGLGPGLPQGSRVPPPRPRAWAQDPPGPPRALSGSCAQVSDIFDCFLTFFQTWGYPSKQEIKKAPKIATLMSILEVILGTHVPLAGHIQVYRISVLFWMPPWRALWRF